MTAVRAPVAPITCARGSAFGRRAAITGARGSAFGGRAAIALMLVVGCGERAAPAPPVLVLARPDVVGSAASSTPTLPPERLTCARDEGCAFDPVTRQCGNDPRYNRQPDLVDQGIACYCEEGHCGTLRVWPIPCESDESCAVSLKPRPHPIAASKTAPHESGKRCRDYKYWTTCERTNICTMHGCP